MKLPTAMTAKTGNLTALDRTDGFAEQKFDGTRTFLIKRGPTTRIFNGRGEQSERTKRFPPIIQQSKQLRCNSCVLDAEMVFYQNGKEYFINSNASQETRNERRLTYKLMVFDILEKNGVDLRKQPIQTRKKILNQTIPNLPLIKISSIILKNKKEFFHQQIKKGHEGVMFKRFNSTYQSKKSKDWLKVKKFDTIDIIAQGYTPGTGIRKPYFRNLHCYLPTKNGLKHIGDVGGGFKEQDLKEVTPLAKSGKPFIIEVQIMEWSRNGHMRMPSFVRLRPDKTLKEVEQKFMR